MIAGASLAAGLLLQPGVASASGMTMADLAGSWQVEMIGTTGCGFQTMQANFTLDGKGDAHNSMTLVGHGQCGDGTTQHLQFVVNSLNADGSGTASLYCAYNTAVCGWNLNIQVNKDRNSFSAVDLVNTANYVSGMGVRQSR
jgi:hypothetical protein